MIELLKSLFKVNDKILILGFGKEGRSTYDFLRINFPSLHITIADLNSEIADELKLKNDLNLKFITGDNYQDHLNDYNLIIKSPGVKLINLSDKVVESITSQTDLFLQCFANQVIGVTGTKGKSTTVSLIRHFAEADNKKVLLLGNIGIPAFDGIDKIENDSIIIYELSAHQLEYINKSPHIAVMLNVFPEHLDYFDDFASYRDAKFNICRFQNKNDYLIIEKSIIKTSNEASTILEAYPGKITIVNDDELKYKIENSPLLGVHNLANINIALCAVNEVGVDVSIALASLENFSTLPHRLEFVGEYNGVKFVNDSISTVPESTIAAVKALKNVDTIILGGYDRGLDYYTMCEFLENSSINNFIFLGKAGDRIFNYFSPFSKKNLMAASSIENVFDTIIKITAKGSICLLSPAAASYDQFNNFEHRGEVFKSLVEKLK